MPSVTFMRGCFMFVKCYLNLNFITALWNSFLKFVIVLRSVSVLTLFVIPMDSTCNRTISVLVTLVEARILDF